MQISVIKKPKQKFTQLQSIINSIFIIVTISWPPVQSFLGFDGAGRIPLMLGFVATFINISSGSFIRLFHTQRNKALISWTILILYMLVNSFFKGFYEEHGAFFFYKSNFFMPLMLLYSILIELNHREIHTIYVLWGASLFLIIIGALGMTSGGISEDGRIDSGYGNLLPLTCVACMFVSGYKYFFKRQNKVLFFAIILICFVVSFYAGTRKALVAEALLLVGIATSLMKKRKLITRVLLISIPLIFIAGYVMDNTAVGERFLSTFESGESAMARYDYSGDSFFLKMMGDRAPFYIVGFEIFLNNFWTGIGTTNFMEVSNSMFRLHSEYMVQMCENGIIGFVILMLFYYIIIREIKNSFTIHPNLAFLISSGLLAIIVINFVAWTYNANFAMVIYAIIIHYVNNYDKSIV